MHCSYLQPNALLGQTRHTVAPDCSALASSSNRLGQPSTSSQGRPSTGSVCRSAGSTSFTLPSSGMPRAPTSRSLRSAATRTEDSQPQRKPRTTKARIAASKPGAPRHKTRTAKQAVANPAGSAGDSGATLLRKKSRGNPVALKEDSTHLVAPLPLFGGWAGVFLAKVYLALAPLKQRSKIFKGVKG